MKILLFYFILFYIALFYYQLGNLRPEYHSKLSSIHLLCVTKSQTLTRYGPHTILAPVLKDIQLLEKVTVINSLKFFNEF